MRLGDGSFRPRSPSPPGQGHDPMAPERGSAQGAALREEDGQLVVAGEDQPVEDADDVLLPWKARRARLKKQAEEAALELRRFEVGVRASDIGAPPKPGPRSPISFVLPSLRRTLPFCFHPHLAPCIACVSQGEAEAALVCSAGGFGRGVAGVVFLPRACSNMANVGRKVC